MYEGVVLPLVIFLFLVVAVAVAVGIWLGGRNTPFLGGKESSLDILKKRYAKGEIGKEEFEKLRKDIQ